MQPETCPALQGPGPEPQPTLGDGGPAGGRAGGASTQGARGGQCTWRSEDTAPESLAESDHSATGPSQCHKDGVTPPDDVRVTDAGRDSPTLTCCGAPSLDAGQGPELSSATQLSSLNTHTAPHGLKHH